VIDVGFVATTTVAASTRITDPDALYYKPDNTFVGRGSDLRQGRLSTGLWVNATNQAQTEAPYAVWTGSLSPMTLATTTSNCEDWSNDQSSAPAPAVGNFSDANLFWLDGGDTPSCEAALRLYCIEP
jgi:hypothetical protein